MVYVFIHKEKRDLKSEKFEAQALKGILVGYNGYIIYQVFIQSQDKVIWVKDLCIFEDTSQKTSTSLPNFSGKPTFEGFLATDKEAPTSSESENDNRKKSSKPTHKPSTNSRLGCTLKPITKARENKKAKTLAKQKTSTSSDDLITHLTKLLIADWEG